MSPSLLQNFKKGIRNPSGAVQMLLDEPEEIWRRINDGFRIDLLKLYAMYQRRFQGYTGVEFMKEDWDTMLILDSCRYDLFQEVNGFDAPAREVLSSGSATHEFLKRNMAGQVFPDTVYITANPNSYYVDAKFHAVKSLWADHWNDNLQTVTPDVVADATIEAHREHPNKRLLVHFIQPHYPFIGEIGQQIEQGSLTGGGLIADSIDKRTIWQQVKCGEIDETTAWEAYRENLELTIPHVKRIVKKIDGRSVITSDHGNAFGEFGLYGHWPGLYLRSMLTVPWVEIENGYRRRITEGSIENTEADETVLEERLGALGYK